MTIKIQNLKRTNNKSKIKCTFTVILDNCVEIFNVKLVYSPKTERYYVFFPSYEYKGRNIDYVRFSSPLSTEVLALVLAEYNKKPEITL